MDPRSTAVVLIEFQNDFTSEGGALHGAVAGSMAETNMLENAKPGTRVYPISLFINYHMKMIRLAPKGKLTPQELEKLDTELKTLMDKATELNKPKTPKS